jgi:uncharacterized membrane protein YeiH
MMAHNPHLPLVLDLLGVFAASCSGALTGLRKALDLVGILVLACVTGLGGGMIRDVLIGAIPPAGLADWRYVATALAATVVVLVIDHFALGARLHEKVSQRVGERVRLAMAARVSDAATLGLFTVAGTTKALDHGIAVMPSALLGVVTAVGGGVIRDILINEVPYVLRRELYAVPAFAGALVVALGHSIGHLTAAVAVIAAALTFTFRMLAVSRDWHAPRPGA